MPSPHNAMPTSSIPRPSRRASSLRAAMHLDHDTFKCMTLVMRQLAIRHLDLTRRLPDQRPEAVDKMMGEARGYLVLKHYVDQWPVAVYLTEWLSRRITRHQREQGTYVKTRTGLTLQANRDEAPMRAQAALPIPSFAPRMPRTGTPPRCTKQAASQLTHSGSDGAHIPPTSKCASFRSFLRACKPCLRPLRREFRCAGIKSPADFLRLARLGKKYRERLLRERMRLTELEIAEVQMVVGEITRDV